jgi:hypothetical protein
MTVFVGRSLVLLVIAWGALACQRIDPIVVPPMKLAEVVDEYSIPVEAPPKAMDARHAGDPDRLFLSITLGNPQHDPVPNRHACELDAKWTRPIKD